jgi:hypothetical protein
MIDWPPLKYFHPTGTGDNYGEASKIDHDVLMRLDEFRHELRYPIHVLRGTDGLHSKNSYHYISNGSCALDVFTEVDISAIEIVLLAEKFGFNGLGYYPDWRRYGKKGHGLHLDTRPLGDRFRQARWIGKSDMKGRLFYIPLTYDNLEKYCIR